MNLCERKTAVGESLAKGLEKGSEFWGKLGERVSERGCWVKWVGESKTCSRESIAKDWRKVFIILMKVPDGF